MFFFLATSFCVPIKIRLAGTQRYLRGSNGDSDISHLSDYEKADDYAYVWDDSEKEYLWLRVNNHLEHGLAYSIEEDALVLVHSENKDLQKFRLMPLEPYTEEYWIINSRKCITWQEATFKFVLSECFENENMQKFNIDIQSMDFSGAILLEDFEEEELHGSPNDKPFLKPSHSSIIDKEKNITDLEMQANAEDLINDTYKFLYDMSLCFLEKGTCKKDGFNASKKNNGYSSSKKYSSSQGSSSYSSKSSSSASASSSKKSGMSGSSGYSMSASARGSIKN